MSVVSKRYIENDLVDVGQLAELNRYIDYTILDRIFRCQFYGSFNDERIDLDLNDEVEAVTDKVYDKKSDLFKIIAEIIKSAEEPKTICRNLVVKRYRLLEEKDYIETDNFSGVSELDIIRGIDVDTHIICDGMNFETEEYAGVLFMYFDALERQQKRLSDVKGVMDGMLGHFGMSGGSSDTFPDPSKMFGALFGPGDNANKDPFEKEKE